MFEAISNATDEIINGMDSVFDREMCTVCQQLGIFTILVLLHISIDSTSPCYVYIIRSFILRRNWCYSFPSFSFILIVGFKIESELKTRLILGSDSISNAFIEVLACSFMNIKDPNHC